MDAMNILVVNANSQSEEVNIQNQKLFYTNYQRNIHVNQYDYQTYIMSYCIK